MKKTKLLAILFLCLAGIVPAQAGTKTWSAGTGDWFAPANWGGNPYPTNGDDVVITNAGAVVLLTNSTEYLSSIVISNTATLVFSNWNTKLLATNVYVRTNATVTLPAAFTEAQMSNNVYIICSNLTIDAGGRINADGKGYAGNEGPGHGSQSYMCGGGGGYGGVGGAGYYSYAPYGPAGGVYGSSNAPVDPGSGGGTASATGGSGGGAVRINAGGVVTVNGAIGANGNDGSGWNGAGSGGSIYIQCYTMAGSGSLSANGGNGQEVTSADRFGGGGGGGRIAVIYNTSTQSYVPLRFSAAAGIGAAYGDIGTLYFPDTRFWNQELITHSGQVLISGFASWAPNNLTISNGWVRFMAPGFRLTVTNQVTVVGTNAGVHKLDLPSVAFACGSNVLINGGSLVMGASTSGPTLSCGGDLTLTNGARFRVYVGVTNAAPTAYGGTVTVAGDVVIASNCWIYPYSDPNNGGSVLFRMRSLYILTTNAGFDADSKGFATDKGTGRGYNNSATSSGGGYGGAGGPSMYNGLPCTVGGITYGSSNAPVDPGSGAGSGGGYGGGAVRVNASRDVTINGVITASGGNGTTWYGGGSGGGIYIQCYRLLGSGSLIANGGRSYSGDATRYGGGGGGGRIAVWRVRGILAATVDGGIGYVNGGTGTVVWGQLPIPGTVFFGR